MFELSRVPQFLSSHLSTSPVFDLFPLTSTPTVRVNLGPFFVWCVSLSTKRSPKKSPRRESRHRRRPTRPGGVYAPIPVCRPTIRGPSTISGQVVSGSSRRRSPDRHTSGTVDINLRVVLVHRGPDGTQDDVEGVSRGLLHDPRPRVQLSGPPRDSDSGRPRGLEPSPVGPVSLDFSPLSPTLPVLRTGWSRDSVEEKTRRERHELHKRDREIFR